MFTQSKYLLFTLGILIGMEELLQQAGLNEQQARTYLYLLKQGESSPPAVAKALNLTRSNAYKVLEKLLEIPLVQRSEVQGKCVYRAEDPIALSGLVAAERNRLIALEKGVKNAIHELRQSYERSTSTADIRTVRSNAAVGGMYKSQAELKQPVYFIRSRADVPVMGYELMDKIRHMPAQYGSERFGITQDTPEAPANPAIDRSTNLTRTWIHADDYTAPVEWSVSGDELLIISFEQEASAMRIKNPVVAKAFKELWQLLDRSIRHNPQYKKLPKLASRKV